MRLLALLPASVALEAGAAHAAATGSDDAALGAHACASLLAAIALAAQLPPRFEHRWRLGPLLFGLAWCLPFLGLPGLGLCLVRPLREAGSTRPRSALIFAGVPPLPADAPSLVGLSRAIVEVASVAARSRDPDRRLAALLRTRAWSDRAARPVLSSALKDRSDDVRLLAYGLLAQREKAVSERIAGARARLGDGSAAVPPGLMRQLSFDTWELVYAGHVRGRAFSSALEEALRLTECALSERRCDGGVRLLRGRILLAQGRLAEASASLHQALADGLPRRAVAPYLAEAVFRERVAGASRNHEHAPPGEEDSLEAS